MIPWIRKLLGLCNHKWEDVDLVKYSFVELPESKWYRMRQRCDKCGKYRQVRY